MSDFVSPEDMSEASLWLDRQATAVVVRPSNRPVGRRRIAHSAAVHLLLGDSIALKSGFESRFQRDITLNRCHSGATADIILDNLRMDIRKWEITAAAAESLPRGWAVLWVSANDVYSRYSGRGSIEPTNLDLCGIKIRQIIWQLRASTDKILVLGPLPRPDGDIPPDDKVWEKTAAYHLERAAKKTIEALSEQLRGEERLQFVPLGRCLTMKCAIDKKSKRRHSIRPECRRWYKQDGIHLNESGYMKIGDAEHLPVQWRVRH